MVRVGGFRGGGGFGFGELLVLVLVGFGGDGSLVLNPVTVVDFRWRWDVVSMMVASDSIVMVDEFVPVGEIIIVVSVGMHAVGR